VLSNPDCKAITRIWLYVERYGSMSEESGKTGKKVKRRTL
jgi:hypothetical protein